MQQLEAEDEISSGADSSNSSFGEVQEAIESDIEEAEETFDEVIYIIKINTLCNFYFFIPSIK